MILFNFYTLDILPGNFLDYKVDDALDLVIVNLLNSMNNGNKKAIEVIRENGILDF
jgi:hypothetical protein